MIEANASKATSKYTTTLKLIALVTAAIATLTLSHRTATYYDALSWSPWQRAKLVPVPLANATPTSDLIELPKGCKHRITPITEIVNLAMHHHFQHMKLPLPPDTQRARKMLVEQTGTSMVIYNKSVLDVDIDRTELATCWIPGAEGNFFWPDSILIRMYHFRLKVHILYELEQHVFGHTLQLGGGNMTTEVEGVIILELDMHDMNNTVKRCVGNFGLKHVSASGVISTWRDVEQPLTDEEMSQEVCFGPAYWDEELSGGPRPRGMAEDINQDVRKNFFHGYVAPPPPPPPPFSCNCDWTIKYSCPGSEGVGTKGIAKADDSPCFDYCCPSPPGPPLPGLPESTYSYAYSEDW